jgi:hypothetical protein
MEKPTFQGASLPANEHMGLKHISLVSSSIATAHHDIHLQAINLRPQAKR